MNVLGWAANLWGNNAALPSGAIDVIAVRQPDGSLICSPFHVKLGRSCKKGEKKLVKLRVNGKEVDVCMRLGPAGEAFFLKKVHDIEKLDEDSLIEAPIVGSVLMESVNTADEHQLPASTTPGETPRCDDSGASAFSADGKGLLSAS